MNLHTYSLPRFLTRSKKVSAPKPERVEGIYLQEGFNRLGQNESVSAEAATVLSDYAGKACKNSSAATTLFVP